MTAPTAPPPIDVRRDLGAPVPQRLVVAPGTRHQTDVVVGAHRLAIGGRSVALDDIERVAYSVHRAQANLVQRRFRRRVWLGASDDAIVLELGTRPFGRQEGDREAAVFDAIVRVLHERVEPRLRRRRVAHLCDGGLLRLGPLTLTSTGLEVSCAEGVRSWPWRSAPPAELRGDHVALLDRSRDGGAHCRIDAPIPDAVMLPELLWSASAALI